MVDNTLGSVLWVPHKSTLSDPGLSAEYKTLVEEEEAAIDTL